MKINALSNISQFTFVTNTKSVTYVISFVFLIPFIFFSQMSNLSEIKFDLNVHTSKSNMSQYDVSVSHLSHLKHLNLAVTSFQLFGLTKLI